MRHLYLLCGRGAGRRSSILLVGKTGFVFGHAVQQYSLRVSCVLEVHANAGKRYFVGRR